MQFVVRYLDDERESISDHGRMENDLEDGELVFPDSDTVGYVESAQIEDKEINGIIEPIMMVSGYIYDQRHHNLVKWLRKRHNDNEKIKGSIEVSPKGKNKSIVYENGKFNDDGTLYTIW